MYKPATVQRTYLTLTVLSTLSASFIWGVNTLFLLDAGLSNTQAFAANAAFTGGQVLFEVPTGVVADVRGRKLSYLLGAVTLLISTLLYLYLWQVSAPFWAWAVVSAFLGLGFTFFTGAVEAWLVDALNYTGYTGPLEAVFAKAQIAGGVSMLVGSVAGGFVAQATNLGVPYLVRAAFLVLTFVVAFFMMHDIGFTPAVSTGPIREVKRVLRGSIDNGWKNRPVRWIMLSAPFTTGVMFYAFYAMQPYLLELYGDPTAYGIAGLAAAIVAGAQIVGGLSVPLARKLFRYRTQAIATLTVLSVAALVFIGLTSNLVVAIGFLVLWGLMYAAAFPMRQAYLNGLIHSEERATVLSFDSLMGSAGGVVAQPALGRTADVWGYSASYVVSAGFQLLALPFLLLARRENAASDPISRDPTDTDAPSV
ncbi:MAG: MFS transporter [Armatimonadetes bacterium]|nr:MAG: MFS transporter [Armatimonadota bacterium]